MDIRFFPNTVNREVRLRSYTGLVGKAPEKAKRIKLEMSMPLSGKSMVGAPGWLGDAFEFVEKTQDTVQLPSQSFPGVNVEFSADELFTKQALLPKAALKKFRVLAVGSSEQPDTELQFTMYVGYSSKLLTWIGQHNGECFWAKFDLIPGADGDDDSDPEMDYEDGDDEEEDEEDEKPRGSKKKAAAAKNSAQQSLVGDGFDTERREALKPEHDKEFPPSSAKAGSRRPRGFDRPTNASSIQ
jgi:hypothetical protein